MSPPVPPDEDLRLARLRAYAILDTPPEQAFDRITQIAAAVLDTPIALVSLVDSSRQWFKSRVGLDATETPREVAFCAHAIMGTEVMVVADAQQDPRFAHNPLVLGEPNVRFYAGAPLRTSDGCNLGTLCAIDRVPRRPTLEQTRLLENLAALVIDELELRVAGAQALREIGERRKVEATLREQQRLLELLHAVATTANEASEPGVVIQEALERVCAFTGWPVGFARLAGAESARGRAARSFWHARTPEGFAAFRAALEAGPQAAGHSLAERVMASQKLESIDTLDGEPAYRAGRDAGLRAGIGMPVLVGAHVVAVIEFYADEPMQADHELVVQALTNVAASVARTIEREGISRMKDEFVSTVSHELRTPLTSIKGSLGLVKNGVTGPMPERTSAMLNVAYENADRLIRMVNDILDVEKMQSGAMALRRERIDVVQLIEQNVEANRAYCEALGLRLRIERMAPGATAVGDRDRLTQVLTNLVSNAAKFSPAGGEVVVAVVDRGDTVRVSVSDQGPGIAKEFQHRIFEKFAQAQGVDSRQKGGTGLGLHICKAIVEQHGGAIGFAPAPTRGTTFYFDIPASPADDRLAACCA